MIQRASLTFLLATTLLVAGCDTITGASDVEYSVSGGSQRVSVTYESGSGTSQIASIALPWSYSFKAERDAFLYVSAQIVQGDGTIIVTIRKDGKVFQTAQAIGFASIATASGTNN